MRKILPILIVASALLTPLYPVYAQTDASPAPAASVKRITRPAAASSSAIEKLQAAKDRVAQNPATTVAQDRLGAVQDKLATRAAELRAKLLKFRDKAKADKVDRINSNLTAINTKRTAQMQQSLEKISSIVKKLKTWATEQKTAGKNVADIEQAIADAEGSWASAMTAVQDQADNDYTIVVNTERTVKEDSRASRDKLHADLKLVHDKIVALRKDLADSISLKKGGN